MKVTIPARNSQSADISHDLCARRLTLARSDAGARTTQTEVLAMQASAQGHGPRQAAYGGCELCRFDGHVQILWTLKHAGPENKWPIAWNRQIFG